MTVRRMDVLAVGVFGLTVALTAAVYDRLPERMATHWDLAGNANGWMSRATGASFAPALGVAVWALLRFLPRILPSTERKRLGEGATSLMASLTLCFVAAVHVLVLYVAVVPGATITHGIWLLLGGFYVALGLVLPRIKRNALMGIRTPWTLTSDENWARTQRVAGYSMITAGLLAAAIGALGGPAGGLFATVALLAGALVPAAYSLVLARRQDQGS